MAQIPQKPTLQDLQEYMNQVKVERGWDKAGYLELFLLFSEEVGELAKAIRDYKGIFQEKEKTNLREHLEEEFADVFSYILDLANHFEIDLEKAFHDKEAINDQRIWK